MALKRKATEGATAAAQKKARTVAGAEDDAQLGWQSDDSGDYKVNYTDNGTLRADSEARRQWNYVCTVDGCDQRFNRPCRLEAHMRSHNKERPFACTEPGCDKTFPRKDHLQRHLKNAHSDPAAERTFVCDWQGCGKSFTSNGRLQRHKDVHESKFYCTDFPPCNEAFRKEKALAAHIKTQHMEVKPYPCTFVDLETGDRCTNGYQTENALQRHVYKVHPAEQENGLFCMICAGPGPGASDSQPGTDDMDDTPVQLLSFATQEELMTHVQDCHPPECTECGQKFKSDATLKSHLDTVHADPSQQTQYPCPNPDCSSVFNRKHNLAVHIQTVHEKQAKYTCAPDALHNSKHEDLANWDGENACGASFKAKSSLDQHVRSHHLGLGNRKALRRAAKSKKKPEPSMLSMLTGIGYDKNRDVPCLIDTCPYRFYVDRDLRRHLRATHAMPDTDIEERLRDRDALAGGQFWIGGLEDSAGMFDSAEPSLPQTPAPYFVEGAAAMHLPDHHAMKSNDHGLHAHSQISFFDQQFHDLALLNEDADMDLDLAMGLGGLAPPMDVQEGLGWDMLAPVEQYVLHEE